VNRLLWIGLNDVGTEGTFRWSSGEPVTFTYWATGEPDNALGGEDFVTMYEPGHTYAGRWNNWGERVFDGRPFNGVVELVASKGPPVIERQPFSKRVNLGDTVTIPVLATSSRPLRYQWRFNGVNIGWATNAPLVLTNVQYNQAGVYSVLVNDALASVASSNATLFVNRPPVAAPSTVSLDEDTTALITLAGSDPDGDPLAYSGVTAPMHGSLTGIAPNFTYRPVTNFNGLDSFTFKVNDGLRDSPVATVSITVNPINDRQLDSAPVVVSITVLPVNDPPEPKIVVSPLTQLPGFSNLVVIAPVCRNARAILDGSQSSDVENDPLQYAWTEGTNALGTTATVTNQFAPGNHTVTLVVNDGTDSATATTTFAVLTPEEAVRSLALAVREAQLGRRHIVPLLAALRAAAEAFERCRAREGLHLLNRFQRDVHDRIVPQDPTLANTLMETAQEIMEIVAGAAPGHCRVVFHEPARWSHGKMQMKFSAPKSQTYFVEASTNLTDWEIIGVAEARGDGTFFFEDPSAGNHARRFYRVLAP
jgi:hypothetical protein